MNIHSSTIWCLRNRFRPHGTTDHLPHDDLDGAPLKKSATFHKSASTTLLTPLLMCLLSYPMEWILGYLMTSNLLNAMGWKHLVGYKRMDRILKTRYIPRCLYVVIQYRYPSLSSFDWLGPNCTAGFNWETKGHIEWKSLFPLRF